ncbi:MAG: ATP-dependent DNA helicase [bacterium]|nr:ATP-dependent DNA helicase [bacterium]
MLTIAEQSNDELELLQQVRISVRNLVEFLLRSGDIDNRKSRGMQTQAMQEGSRIHKKLQRAYGGDYMAEIPLGFTIRMERYELTIEGRADGIFTRDGLPCIDEIKGVYQDVSAMEEPVGVHLAQAKCYAFMHAARNNLEQIGIQMSYCDLDSEEVNRFFDCFEFEELEKWFDELLQEYAKWADFQYEWRMLSIATIKQLQFPYEYRPGQKQLVEDVYRTILRKKNLFIEAPTGTGKTLSTLFPAICAVGEEQAEKLFYLTAKTLTATVAIETLGLFAEHGYRGKIVQITAKEKLCKCEKPDCNPVACPYAKGHYDRINDAVFALLQKEDFFTREALLAHADEYMVCPFELCLDLATWSDVIIGDYNYVFDPTVYLKRFFAEGVKGDYLFLIDEAHNLVERGRQMYSQTIVKEDVLELKRILKPYSARIAKAADKVNRILLEYKHACEEYEIYDNINALLPALMRLASELERFLQKPLTIEKRDEVMEFYFNLRGFLNIYELVDENYVIYSSFREDGAFYVKLYCADPSVNLQRCLDKGRSAILFSATLLPIQYYKKLLSTREDNYAVYAQSVFSKEQRLLLIGTDVSSKYTRRTADEFWKIAQYIIKIASSKKGNYIAFFPSYRLMEQVYEQFVNLQDEKEEITAIVQTQNMKEEQREAFLQEFDAEKEQSMVAFCVMGGIFGEGLDLREDKLIGAIVVGTGLPQINFEGEILKNFFDNRDGNGFDYVYRYPGMNKVQQAAGRVIRTQKDRGIIALLDDRFLQGENLRLFPREWQDYRCTRLEDIERKLSGFWESDFADGGEKL